MDFTFTLDTSKWSMWEFERAEYSAGYPLHIKYGIQEEPIPSINESAIYYPHDLSKTSPIPQSSREELYIPQYTEEEMIKKDRHRKQVSMTLQLARDRKTESIKKEDAEDAEDWYNDVANDALQRSVTLGFRTEEEERKIALADEANNLIILE